ncbi:hypothetical protein [Arthrobacter sp. SDTb3-6]|uniref:hypothetical protein n=1 Tax=Arthrobacter sp. SDTb3-6 TaxID=2713571 RepID=UPI00210BBE80|nr:hypothetical protein [Arthrobacter sp. SDTb3-6]
MHDFHRSGIGPAGLKAYLAQPHWLYVATFADGTVKVGTASQRSKWSRLAEQGAIVARYVAHARDGSVVRVLEDAVSAGLGLTQFVRGTAKFAALLQPRPGAELEAANAAAAGTVRDFLGTAGVDGFEPVSASLVARAAAAVRAAARLSRRRIGPPATDVPAAVPAAVPVPPGPGTLAVLSMHTTLQPATDKHSRETREC